MKTSEVMELLTTMGKLIESTKFLALEIDSKRQSDPTQDITGDFQKNVILIIRGCEALQEHYKQNIMRRSQ